MDYEQNDEINHYYLTARMLTGRPGLVSIFLSVLVSFSKHSKISSRNRQNQTTQIIQNFWNFRNFIFQSPKRLIKRNQDNKNRMQPICIRFGVFSMFLARKNMNYIGKSHIFEFRPYNNDIYPWKGHNNPRFYRILCSRSEIKLYFNGCCNRKSNAKVWF